MLSSEEMVVGREILSVATCSTNLKLTFCPTSPSFMLSLTRKGQDWGDPCSTHLLHFLCDRNYIPNYISCQST